MTLHLGVHKTATTHFQSRLYNSIPQLSEKGIGYLDLDQTRKYLTSKIFGKIKLEGGLKNVFEQNHKLIISDENIIGGTDRVISEKIYPDAEPRLSFLLENLPLGVEGVHITIRDPESYLISRYCEYLRHYRFMSVIEYFDSFDLKYFSWLPLLQSIEAAVGKKVTVTTFENIFHNEEIYLEKLTGVKVEFGKAGEGAAIRRSKITQESYRILEHLSDHYPRHMTKKLMNMMDNNKQRTKETPLRPFSDEISKTLKQNYKKDKEELGLT